MFGVRRKAMRSSDAHNELEQSAVLMPAIARLVAGGGLAATVFLTVGGTPTVAQTVLNSVNSPQLNSPQLNSPQTVAQMPSTTASYLLFVNPTLGNDSNNGNQGTPLRTITRALQLAQGNTVILLAPGTYSADTGETFPLLLKPGVTLQGDPGSQGQGIVVRGGGSFLSPTSAQQNVAILATNGSVVTGITLSNPNPRGYGLWIESSSPTVVGNTFSGSRHDGISIVGNGSPLVQSNAFVQNGANGISIYGSSQAQVRDNVFERTGYGIHVAQTAAPVITGNRISNNRSGVVIQDTAQPTLQGNLIEGSQEDGVVAIARSLPNLGTASAPGNNTFQNNGRYDINASAASQIISASGNQLVSSRTTGRVDIAGTGAAIAAVPPAPAMPAAPAMMATPARMPAPPSRSTPAVPTAVSMSVTSTNSPSSGFASVPRLPSAAPIAVPSQPVTVQTARPTPPERLPLQPTPRSLTPAASPISATSFPHPNTTAAGQASAPTPLTSNGRSASPTAIATRPQLNSLPTRSQADQQTGIPIPVIAPPGQISRNSTTLSRNDNAIEIPVQGPTSAAAPESTPMPQITVRQVRQSAPALSSANAPRASAVPIRVPLPAASRVTPPAPTTRSLTTAPQPSRPVPQANLLPVPGADIPVGNIGDMPRVLVSRNSLQSPNGTSFAMADPSNALVLRYRVVVEADDEGVQDFVRSLVPGAFRTYANGRVMMQAGAYSDRDNADEAARQLSNSGLRAMVQPLE